MALCMHFSNTLTCKSNPLSNLVIHLIFIVGVYDLTVIQKGSDFADRNQNILHEFMK